MSLFQLLPGAGILEKNIFGKIKSRIRNPSGNKLPCSADTNPKNQKKKNEEN